MQSDVLACRACSFILTEPVERVRTVPERPGAQDDGGRRPPTMPRGTWAVDPEPRAVLSIGESGGSTDCLVLDPADGVELEPHPDPTRSSGCCGHDGCDGPNRRCPRCHADVATLSDDCWTVVELRFEPAAVTVVPAGQPPRAS